MPESPRGHALFTVWNRSGNRLVAGVLGTALHPLLSRRLMLITVTGRRSGAKHTFPVAYEQDAGKLSVPVLWPERKLWWRNLLDGAPVNVRLRGADRSARAHALTDDRGGVTVQILLDGTPERP